MASIDLAWSFVADMFFVEVFQGSPYLKAKARNQAEIIRIAQDSACSPSLYVITLVAVLNSRSTKIDSHPVS